MSAGQEPLFSDDAEVSSDVVDQGNSTADLFLKASLSNRQGSLEVPEKHPDFDGQHCVDCAVEIPQARLDHGRVRCVECQTLVERQARQVGRRYE